MAPGLDRLARLVDGKMKLSTSFIQDLKKKFDLRVALTHECTCGHVEKLFGQFDPAKETIVPVSKFGGFNEDPSLTYYWLKPTKKTWCQKCKPNKHDLFMRHRAHPADRELFDEFLACDT